MIETIVEKMLGVFPSSTREELRLKEELEMNLRYQKQRAYERLSDYDFRIALRKCLEYVHK